jgi:HEAT repeat protein
MRSSLTALAGFFVLAFTLSVYGQGSGTKESPKEILGKTIKEWLVDLKSGDPSAKVKALQAIPYFGEAARKEAGNAVVDAIPDPDASVRANALLALMAIGLPEKDIPHCVEVVKGKLINDTQGIIRLHCASVLGQIGTGAKLAIPELIRATMDSSSFEIRKTAVTALGYVGAGSGKDPSDARATRALVAVFYGPTMDKSADVRLEAVMAVALMAKPGPAADRAHALQALQYTATHSKDKSIEIWARVGIMAHEEVSEKELAQIAKYLSDKDLAVRMQAIRALGTIGPKAKSHVEKLIEMLDDKELSLAYLAAVALGQMGDAAKKAVPAIEELSKKKDLDDATKDALKDVIAQINGKKPK